jgi:predicted DsbA family dithiol-disulfide isomerase
MHAMLLANQDALEVDDLLGYAEAAGVSTEAVADDLASGRCRRHVLVDVHGALQSGVAGTPAFFVDGRRYEGGWTDADRFAAALVDAAAAKQD